MHPMNVQNGCHLCISIKTVSRNCGHLENDGCFCKAAAQPKDTYILSQHEVWRSSKVKCVMDDGRVMSRPKACRIKKQAEGEGAIERTTEPLQIIFDLHNSGQNLLC
uniref:Uncharacterized protein n=1 Tax=Micrurus lemniscatus lemniscatus TaxID=129467 RepID=A0A2D4JBF7_MICLE